MSKKLLITLPVLTGVVLGQAGGSAPPGVDKAVDNVSVGPR
ncbi:MAG: hypothetical protein ABIQ16_02235 [Polyangiaceae bacterium]